ncbi:MULTISPECIES: glutathione transferase GstA [Pseudomonas]|jgi:glutathione S-transferase|uniref:glutathione transferase GstA n=1 Tax=Pseudomonas TaxID=286 RepID=UPI0009D2F35A|nr:MULTISPECIES: glutathione transferase GstA [unclassified Pseudomonas]OPK05584.1 glutathione transferase GstA [Pseudomonas veronii]UHH01034.1 glutathione transferase GstA [Pseudomonas sp. 7-41]WLD69454.1 glutathione transferase GstA [Pseudomonas sp. OVF7]
MKLYYAPGACSLAVHIALQETGFDFALEKVDLATHRTESNIDFSTINPKGYVPALVLDDGELLTEVSAILLYLADRADKSLAPSAGSMARYHLYSWLNFITSELHKAFSPLFNPCAPDEWKIQIKQTLTKRCEYVAAQLAGKQFLLGDSYTVADAYLFTVLGWSRLVQFDLASWPTINEYLGRIAGRPAIQAALKREGLLG